MKKTVIKYLVCPKCKGELRFTILDQNDSEILSGTFICGKCDSIYKIKNGIPVFAEIYRKEDIKNITSSRFGWQWNYFSEFDKNVEEKKFLEWIYPTDKDFFGGKIVLDAGCGMARHAVLSSLFGAEQVIGIDLGSSVLAAYENTKEFPNVHIIQADIYNLPFNNEAFDFIYSIGVIHHLPEPQKGFESIIKHLKPKGKINIWVYGRENNGWVVYFVNPIRKRITSKIPLNILLYLSLIPSFFIYLITKFLYKPVNNLSSKVFLPYKEYFLWVAGLSFKNIHEIVFDHLVTPVAFYHRKEEIVDWFDKNKLINYSFFHRNKMSWAASAEKK